MNEMTDEMIKPELDMDFKYIIYRYYVYKKHCPGGNSPGWEVRCERRT